MSDLFDSPAELWWGVMPGPVRFRKQLCRKIEAGKHILLNEAKNILWINMLEDKCRQWNNRNQTGIWKVLDASLFNDTPPGKILLKEYAQKEEIKTGYRSISGKSIENYLIDNGVLTNHIVWVRNIPENKALAWVECAKRYSSNGIQQGILIIECPKRMDLLESKNYAILDYAAEIHEYDSYSFCSQMLLESEYKNDVSFAEIRYLTTIFSQMCQMDVLPAISLLKKRPTELMKLSLDKFVQYFPHVREEELKIRYWQAQLQELFPIIEKGRLYLLVKYKGLFEELWNSNEKIRYSAQGELRSGVEDLEIGDICYWLGSHRGEPCDYDIAQHLRNCRNQLAHRAICSVNETLLLFTYLQQNFNKHNC